MRDSALIGRTITGWTLSDDHETLTFRADGGTVSFETKGDCCSQSWIESIDAPEVLTGKVLAVEDIEMPDLGNVATDFHGGVDQVSYYGLRITTERGVCVLDYRNDSNGYYGGWINEHAALSPAARGGDAG